MIVVIFVAALAGCLGAPDPGIGPSDEAARDEVGPDAEPDEDGPTPYRVEPTEKEPGDSTPPYEQTIKGRHEGRALAAGTEYHVEPTTASVDFTEATKRLEVTIAFTEDGYVLSSGQRDVIFSLGGASVHLEDGLYDAGYSFSFDVPPEDLRSSENLTFSVEGPSPQTVGSSAGASAVDVSFEATIVAYHG